jgi:hypothetical protein
MSSSPIGSRKASKVIVGTTLASVLLSFGIGAAGTASGAATPAATKARPASHCASRNCVLGRIVSPAERRKTHGARSLTSAMRSPVARSEVRPALATGPNPNAPHGGAVAGAQYGSQIAIRSAAVVGRLRAIGGRMGVHFPGRVSATTIHETIGTQFESYMVGSQANQSVSTSIVASKDTTLYMPTMYPGDGSCIEVSTVYTASANYVGAWDWCHANTFEAEVTINASFISTYTRHGAYSVQIVQTAASTNTWTAYLYDYSTGRWNQFYRQSGTGYFGLSALGWDMFEMYSTVSKGTSAACADLAGQTVSSSNIELKDGSTWKPAGKSNASGLGDHPVSAFDCAGLKFDMLQDYSHWQVVDPAKS